jgi:hypothetical protein
VPESPRVSTRQVPARGGKTRGHAAKNTLPKLTGWLLSDVTRNNQEACHYLRLHGHDLTGNPSAVRLLQILFFATRHLRAFQARFVCGHAQSTEKEESREVFSDSFLLPGLFAATPSSRIAVVRFPSARLWDTRALTCERRGGKRNIP